MKSVVRSKYLVFHLLRDTVRNLVTVYVEVEANKIITKEGRVSFDFESDVWSSQPSALCFDNVSV